MKKINQLDFQVHCQECGADLFSEIKFGGIDKVDINVGVCDCANSDLGDLEAFLSDAEGYIDEACTAAENTRYAIENAISSIK